MGQSTDAILMFGVNLGEGEDMEWPAALIDGEEDSNWPDLDRFISDKLGLIEPAGEDYRTPEWTAHFTAQRAAIEAYGIDLVPHCSNDYPMWVIAVRRTVQRASRGYPATPVMGPVTDDEIAALKAFCDETGLTWSEPSWVLCSNWS